MADPRSSPGTLRERSFLVLGLGAALVLVLAALVGGGDPESAGRAELVSTAARIAEAIRAEWRDWPSRVEWNPHESEGRGRWDSVLQSRMEWKDGELPYIEGHELLPQPGPGNEVFDALFAKAEQVELVEQNSSAALELVLEALQKTKDPARRAEARLRAIRLAVKFEPIPSVVEQFKLACAELDGSERKGPISYRLLLAEAIRPIFSRWPERSPDKDDSERSLTPSAVEDQLRDLEARHALAWVLPPAHLAQSSGDEAVVEYTEDAQTEALLELLRSAFGVPPFVRPKLAFDREFTRLRCAEALKNELGAIPHPESSSFELRHMRTGFLVYWNQAPVVLAEASGLPEGSLEEPNRPLGDECQTGGFVSPHRLRDAFLESAHISKLLPGGFVVDIDPPASKATAVREHDSLDGDFGFTVKHEDPEGWVRRSAAKQKLLRGALLVLALLSGAAGVATFRALRRERTLATLKTDFVANVSHELRTPLASILLLSENLEAGRVTSEADKSRYHTLIRREALRLRRLVDDVLDFSRLERGKRIDIRREALRVDPWLERACEELAEWAREHSLELAIERSPTESEAEIDAEALRRALLNLLDNARKHSGGTKVELGALREGRELVLRVRDHGLGISAEDRERVFEPFMRLANGDAPGAGLGLSIVREIAREHGGTVRALDPESGPGIVFEMRIPLAEETTA